MGTVGIQVLAVGGNEAVLAVLVNLGGQDNSSLGNGHLAVCDCCRNGFQLVLCAAILGIGVSIAFCGHCFARTSIIDHDLIAVSDGIDLCRGGRSLALCEYRNCQREYHDKYQQQRKQFLCALHFFLLKKLFV